MGRHQRRAALGHPVRPDRSRCVTRGQILARRHEEFGFDSVITHEPNLEALGKVIAASQ